jgi:hypothetical protein
MIILSIAHEKFAELNLYLPGPALQDVQNKYQRIDSHLRKLLSNASGFEAIVYINVNVEWITRQEGRLPKTRIGKYLGRMLVVWHGLGL